MFRLTAISRNKKTGPIPVSTSGKETCPSTCPFKGRGCYAESGPLNIVWDSKCNDSARAFLSQVKGIPAGQLWRHNQADDLPHRNNHIDRGFVEALVKANRRSRGFTYTHHLPDVGDNLQIIQNANSAGFTVNLSANNPDQAVQYAKLGVPVVTVVPENKTKNFKHKGRQFIVCPATKPNSKMTCAKCGLCAKRDRNCIVTFPAHGMRKKLASGVAAG